MSRTDGKTIRGRGTASSVDPRYLDHSREVFDDGWEREDDDTGPRTTVTVERPRTVISRNDSPDVPFEQSLNPYRGCEHGCVYCLSGDTLILMADESCRALSDIKAGDWIYGTVRDGRYRRYVKTQVKAHWSTVKPAYRITLEDGTTLVASADHRFLTERGWKFVKGTQSGRNCRPHLTPRNKLMGTGMFAAGVIKGKDYKQGYLCGMIRGDGHLATYHYPRTGRRHGNQYQFRLALCDIQALDITGNYLADFGINIHNFVFQEAEAGSRTMYAIRNHSQSQVSKIEELIGWPLLPSVEWSAGFLAGIFDAEGCYSSGTLRISNTDNEIISWIKRCLHSLGFRYIVEFVHRQKTKPIKVVRLVGGLREQLRFFHTVDPAIPHKRDIEGRAVKSDAKLGIISIESIGKALRLYDITTGTGDFIANGVISHNCYARPTHAYLDLSPGIDFETRLFAKPDAPQLLRRELSKKTYRASPLALGSNTDPYQPAERHWRITRGVIEVLAETRHPLTIVTKSSLVERDIDLLAPMAEQGLVQVYVSVTSLDQSLTRRLEPRSAAPARRLQTLAALHRAGIPTGTLFAPVIPFLNDAEMESVLEAVAAAGVESAGYVMLRLPHEIKDLFRDWLGQHEPGRADHVMGVINDLRGGRDNDARFHSRMRGAGHYADLIRQRFDKACRRLDLNRKRRVLDTSLFVAPRPPSPQGDLFDF